MLSLVFDNCSGLLHLVQKALCSIAMCKTSKKSPANCPTPQKSDRPNVHWLIVRRPIVRAPFTIVYRYHYKSRIKYLLEKIYNPKFTIPNLRQK